MAQVVKPDPFQISMFPDPSPRGVKIHHASVLPDAREYPRAIPETGWKPISVRGIHIHGFQHPLQFPEDLRHRRRHGHCPRPRLAVPQPELLCREIHILPAKFQNLVSPAPRFYPNPVTGQFMLRE